MKVEWKKWRLSVEKHDYSEKDMEARIARFGKMKPNKMAFLDTRLPNHVRDIFNIIGSGVNENMDTMPAISSVNGFTVTYNGCESGKGAALHSHETCEVFIPLTGRWSVYWGQDGEHEAILDPFDVISLPTGILRGFKNVSDEYSILMAIIEGNNPGKVGWHNDVVESAKSTGLELDVDGNLIDHIS